MAVEELPAEWLDALRWRDWIEAWRQISEAEIQWRELYRPFIGKVKNAVPKIKRE